MSKRTRNILIGIILFLVAVNVIALIANKNHSASNSTTVLINQSDFSVKINDTPIPSYNVKDMVYIAAEDLQLFNFTIDSDDSKKICRITNTQKNYTPNEKYLTSLSQLESDKWQPFIEYTVYLDSFKISGGKIGRYILIPVNSLENIGSFSKSDSLNVLNFSFGEPVINNTDATAIPKSQDISVTPPTVDPNAHSTLEALTGSGKIIVLDPGHGLSSNYMSADDKRNAGWIYNDDKGQWGEWRHWKSGTTWQDCNGSGCSGRVTEGGSCWYPIGNGDRDVEPDINLQNCLAAKKYLEEMGYTVRLTRQSNNENPSITKRLTNCYPNNDTSQAPDALAYVCVHSNAGGGRGSAYIELSGLYDQAGIPSNYAADGNALGKSINDRITLSTSLSPFSGGSFEMPELIVFCKSPVISAYLEIGFFDNESDLNILKSESDSIGKAIAEGIRDYFG